MLKVTPQIWRQYTKQAVRPWSVDAVDIDVQCIRALDIKESPNRIATRWGWNITDTLAKLNKHPAPKAPRNPRTRKAKT